VIGSGGSPRAIRSTPADTTHRVVVARGQATDAIDIIYE